MSAQPAGRRAAVQGDVAREEDVAAMYDAAEALGPVTAVVVNAGIVGQVSAVADMATDRIRRLFDVNVLGAFLTAREAARRMPVDRGGPGGAIVIVSSAAARLGAPGEFVDYAASKGRHGHADARAGQGARARRRARQCRAPRVDRDRDPRLGRRARAGRAAGRQRADGPRRLGRRGGAGDPLARRRRRLLCQRRAARHRRRGAEGPARAASGAPGLCDRGRDVASRCRAP